MVVEPLPRDRHPATAALVVEVAVTTLRHDTAKARRYARMTLHGENAIVPAPAGAPPVEVAELLGRR